MATKNADLAQAPVGVRPLIGSVKATAVAADDTAGSFTIAVTSLPSGGSIGQWVAFIVDSGNVQKLLDVTLSGSTFTVADDGVTTTVAAGDIAQIIYTINY